MIHRRWALLGALVGLWGGCASNSPVLDDRVPLDSGSHPDSAVNEGGAVDATSVDTNSFDANTCTMGATCTPDDACLRGRWDCASDPPHCEPTEGTAPNGTPCAAPSLGEWSPCSGFATTCATGGTHSRSGTNFICVEGTCQPMATTLTEACVRETHGLGCGAPSCSAYGSCGSFMDRCDTTGLQQRTCQMPTCRSGLCDTSTTTEERSCSRTLEETCGDLEDSDCDGTCDEGCRVPIYRGLRDVDHLYTRIRSELAGAGYADEGVVFYIYATNHPGLVPYYRCRSGGDHFLSRDAGCEGQVHEGVLGYVRATSAACGSTPLYRAVRPGDHLYTTNPAEVVPPYSSEGVNAHVWAHQ